MKKFKLIMVGYILTCFGSSVLLGVNSTANSTNATTSENRLEILGKYARVMGTIEQYYVDDLTLSELIDKSIDGLLTNLDAHSGYMDEKKFSDLKVQTDGEFGGLGITIGLKDGAITIIAPIEGTPADKVGLKSGDIILKINEKSTIGMTIDEAVSLMRGEPKTKISITIVRKGENKPMLFEIVRDIIKVESVYSKIIQNENILYIRVTSFDKNVAEKTEEIIKNNNATKGIVLDLRNNPGGLLNQAVELTDLFLDDGIIVSQKGRETADNIVFKATKKVSTLAPIVVLVNGGSASASEIVSGSLQDHKRAIVVGEKTFGKGSVQTIIPVSKTEAMRLTIARYYLPSGRTIQAVGVTPDVIVYSGLVPHDESIFSFKEQDLKKHLQGELSKIDDNTTSKKVDTNKENEKNIISEQNLLNDLQLKSAVDIIKVLNLSK